MSDKMKMVKVVALHDLSYLDHERKPQYRRQSSVPFPMDPSNVEHFLRRKAIRIVDKDVLADRKAAAEKAAAEKAAAEKAAAEEEFEDDFSEESEANVTESADEEAALNPAGPRGKSKRRGR